MKNDLESTITHVTLNIFQRCPILNKYLLPFVQLISNVSYANN